MKRHRCPQCDTRVERNAPSFPFCSKRCRLVDLGRWFKEEYRIEKKVEDESPAPQEEGD